MNELLKNVKNKSFNWYVLMINSIKVKIIVEDLKKLHNPNIREIVSVSDLYKKSNIRNNMIFIELIMNNDIKRRILHNNNIFKFFPNNQNPCIINNIGYFLSSFEKNKINDNDLNKEQDIINLNKEEKNINLENYKSGSLVVIKDGPFKNYVGNIKEIDFKNNILFIEISFLSTLLTTEVNIYDVELFKN